MSSNSINPASTISQPSLKPGDKFDKFEVVEQIGAGGMSVVWKAFDRLLNRHVAIKQLLPATSDRDQLRERFRQEALIQKKITYNQKMLVNIIDFIDEPRGLFIVMEYVEGTTLEQLLAQSRGPMEERQALGIVGSIAMALDVMHAQGVIHRDLKPTNVLLPKAGGLKICDFGLAAMIADQDSLTQGSVRYMAPEMFHEDRVGPRADIYSLGMIAYELLAGRDKFEDAFKFVLRDQRNLALRWMKWHTNPRAKAPGLTTLNPAVPPAIDELVNRMMEKDPPGRIASAKDVVEAIRRHFTGGQPAVPASATTAIVPGGPMTATPTEKTAALPKRSKLPLILTAVILGEAISMFAFYEYTEQQKIVVAAQAVHSKAVKLYNSGMSDYKLEHWSTAETAFDQLSKDFPNDFLAPQAQAFSVLAQARWDLTSGRYPEAIEGFKKADQMSALKDYRDIISNYRRQAEASLAFVNLERQIKEAITASKLGEARILIDQVRKLTLTKEEKERIEQLGEQIEARDRGAIFTSLLAEIDVLIEAQKWSEALTKLNKMDVRFPANLDVRSRLRKVQGEIDYNALLEAAKAAEFRKNTVEAIDAYTRVVAMRPNPAFSKKISQWKSEQAYDEGRKLLAAGNVGGARQSFLSAVALSEHPGAKDELKKLEAQTKEADYISAGDDAFRKDDFNAAIVSYRNALKFRPNPDLEAKISECKLQLKLREARKELEAGRLDTAKSLYTEAQTLSADNKEAKDKLEYIDRKDKYDKLLAAGDAARRDGKFGEASVDYRKAQKVADEPEVRERLNDNDYERCLAQGRDYMRASRWNDARAILLTAKRIRDTEEVQVLLAKVSENDPGRAKDE